MIRFLFILITAISLSSVFAQDDTTFVIGVDSVRIEKRAIKKKERIAKREARRIKNIRPYNALAPSKAAFYSAVLPGLGQAYTGKYWKIPIVYGALGTGVGIALWNLDRQNEIRDIFKDRKRGIRTDRFIDPNTGQELVSDDGLARAQRNFQRQKELSIAISIGLYVLQIIDANVTAHLQQYNLNDKLSLAPKLEIDNFNTSPNYGMSLKYNF